jgi:hypothetical protein
VTFVFQNVRECSRRDRRRITTYRLMVADSVVEKALATHWVDTWASAIGDLHISVFAKGRPGYKHKR